MWALGVCVVHVCGGLCMCVVSGVFISPLQQVCVFVCPRDCSRSYCVCLCVCARARVFMCLFVCVCMFLCDRE